ncbi:MAG: NADH-quinone oxidoreductase subunit H [Candidatus Obscuribacterales bacterium]|nr:NADH-quinone oxidoreductase subunit H [Candidatus Obscuribacterales bacterium]
MTHDVLILNGCKWIAFIIVLFLSPPILLGLVRKTKARMQGRVGARVTQPLHDLLKMLKKGETLSSVTSWIFRSTAVINFAVLLLIAVLTPWLSFKPQIFEHEVPYYATSRAKSSVLKLNEAKVGQSKDLPVVDGLSVKKDLALSKDAELPAPTSVSFFDVSTTGSDIFLIIYMFALARLFTVLAALDAGSVFGGFGASREVTLALLVEPAIVLAFASLGCAAHTSDLNLVFSWAANNPIMDLAPLWFIAGFALFLASLVELSRMPVDDPTTHLELTMVHEAMILENSGRNLALVEFTHVLKMAVLLGLTGQCFLHGFYALFKFDHWMVALFSLLSLGLLSILIGVIESATVKLRWTKIPEFIAYSVAMSLLCVFIAIGVRR